jgi:hypothetical protein
MKMVSRCLIAFLLVLLAACTVDETSQSTPPPPITLEPPPEITLSGTCDETSALEGWLQTTSFALSSFITTMNTTAGQERAAMYENIQALAALRDSSAAAVVPDCAVGTQLRMVDAMNRAVAAFQSFFNGDQDGLGSTIGDVSAQLDQIIAEQSELIARLESQFNQQNSQ